MSCPKLPDQTNLPSAVRRYPLSWATLATWQACLTRTGLFFFSVASLRGFDSYLGDGTFEIKKRKRIWEAHKKNSVSVKMKTRPTNTIFGTYTFVFVIYMTSPDHTTTSRVQGSFFFGSYVLRALCLMFVCDWDLGEGFGGVVRIDFSSIFLGRLKKTTYRYR